MVPVSNPNDNAHAHRQKPAHSCLQSWSWTSSKTHVWSSSRSLFFAISLLLAFRGNLPLFLNKLVMMRLLMKTRTWVIVVAILCTMAEGEGESKGHGDGNDSDATLWSIYISVFSFFGDMMPKGEKKLCPTYLLAYYAVDMCKTQL
jgi:hypothetical protein